MNSTAYPNFFDSMRHFFAQKSALPRLILANVIVFAFVHIVNLFFWLFRLGASGSELSMIAEWLAVPSAFSALALKPWTVITYMFLHEDFLHLLFNMMVLYSGGTIFLQYLSQKQLFQTYIFGGLAGALFFILAFNTFPVFEAINSRAIALGASASVLAILVAISVYVPQYTVNLMFIGPIRLKYLALIFLLLDFFSIQGSNPGGHIAHLGGAFWGFLYIMMLKNKFDFYRIFDVFKRRKLKVAYRNSDSQQPKRPLSDEEYNQKRNEYGARVDVILDKISKSGYASLTEEEKEFLFRMSNKNR